MNLPKSILMSSNCTNLYEVLPMYEHCVLDRGYIEHQQSGREDVEARYGAIPELSTSKSRKLT